MDQYGSHASILPKLSLEHLVLAHKCQVVPYSLAEISIFHGGLPPFFMDENDRKKPPISIRTS